MKRLVILICLMVSATIALADEYTVVCVYEKQRVEYGVKAIDNLDNIQEISCLLVPTKVDEGTYSVLLTRKDTNLYKIEGTDLYLETQFCFEICIMEEAVLVIHNYGDISFGTVIFED